MADIVLVHGAWHGGWCWRRVAALLREAGHEVYTPTLTGLGERVHLMTPEVGLDTHIEDVCQLFRFEEIDRAVLVGHSYAGMVIPGVADRLGPAVKALVYLDALNPKTGESLSDIVPRRGPPPAPDPSLPDWLLAPASAERLGVFDAADRAWLARRLVPHPRKTLTDKLVLTGAHATTIPRLYINCTAPAMNPDSISIARAKSDPGWRYVELATGHNAMMTAPKETADLIQSMA